jgi:hypothetical protein
MKRPAVAKKPPLPATLCLLEAIDVGGAAKSPRLSPLHRNEAGSAAFLGVPNRAQQHTLELSMKSSLISAAVLAVATLWAGTAGAAPIGNGATLAPGAEPLVSKVAAFVCVRDDRGWHYMRGERRTTCRPVRPRGAHWGWHCEGPRCGWWHRHERRFYD